MKFFVGSALKCYSAFPVAPFLASYIFFLRCSIPFLITFSDRSGCLLSGFKEFSYKVFLEFPKFADDFPLSFDYVR